MELNDAKTVIKELNGNFDSHHFIQKYTLLFEDDYIDELYSKRQAGKENVFQTLHAEIGLFLSKHRKKLDITPQGKVPSMNIHGVVSEVESWKKQ